MDCKLWVGNVDSCVFLRDVFCHHSKKKGYYIPEKLVWERGGVSVGAHRQRSSSIFLKGFLMLSRFWFPLQLGLPSCKGSLCPCPASVSAVLCPSFLSFLRFPCVLDVYLSVHVVLRRGRRSPGGCCARQHCLQLAVSWHCPVSSLEPRLLWCHHLLGIWSHGVEFTLAMQIAFLMCQISLFYPCLSSVIPDGKRKKHRDLRRGIIEF